MTSSPLARALGWLAAVAGLAAAFAGSPYPPPVDGRDVAAVELAQWIKDRTPGLRVIDVRSAPAFDEYHIPSAEPLPPASQIATSFLPTDTLVLYADDGAGAVPVQASLETLGLGRVLVLRGGLAAWSDDVMNPAIAADAPGAARAEFDRIAALSRYFGGLPRTLDPAEARSKPPSRPVRHGC